ncbi:MAG: NADH-quinone oxidoreductase subunit C [Candidatus Bathyarchaeia archaeon]
MEDVVSLLKQIADVSSIVVSARNSRVSAKVDPSRVKDVIMALKKEGFTHLSAITGLEVEDGIELLYHLSKGRVILTLSIKIPSNIAAVQSITDIIPGAALYEREIHDLLGVKFEGHPELKRLILSDDWPEGLHPLRKQKHEGAKP